MTKRSSWARSSVKERYWSESSRIQEVRTAESASGKRDSETDCQGQSNLGSRLRDHRYLRGRPFKKGRPFHRSVVLRSASAQETCSRVGPRRRGRSGRKGGATIQTGGSGLRARCENVCRVHLSERRGSTDRQAPQRIL